MVKFLVKITIAAAISENSMIMGTEETDQQVGLNKVNTGVE